MQIDRNQIKPNQLITATYTDDYEDEDYVENFYILHVITSKNNEVNVVLIDGCEMMPYVLSIDELIDNLSSNENISFQDIDYTQFLLMVS